MTVRMFQSTPSPLRGGIKGGGSGPTTSIEFTWPAEPPPPTPPLKGEGSCLHSRYLDLE